MGQTIVVTSKPSARPGVRAYECNRSITSMEIERYISADAVKKHRPPDVLASKLFDLGASSVTVYSNIVTVEADPDGWDELEPQVVDLIENLFIHYREGVPVTTGLEEPPA
jgi:Scaffold protein Nfu/NifU N terminal